MTSATIELNPQIEADRRLLQFKTYEDYLDHLVTAQDTCYLQNVAASRTIAALGYRSSGETLSREQFEKRLATVIAYLYPPYKPYELNSEGLVGSDPLQMELAIRERPNRIGIVSTIIYIRYYNKFGFEISGYIDYAGRLLTEDWTPFFRTSKKFYPKPDDLGYMHWKRRKVTTNNSINYKVMTDPRKGLIFQNCYDRMTICVNPDIDPGVQTRRQRVETKLYPHVILYDHFVRQRI